jgi:hypothetical protein
MKYDMIARLMAMRDEEGVELRETTEKKLEEYTLIKNDMERTIDFKEIDYDDEEWMMYEDVLLTIHMCEEKLETIENFYENYDYYFDFDVEECDDEE